jgi:Response regulator receiver domain
MRRFNGSPKNQHPGGASSGTNQIWVALYFVTHQPPSSSDRPIVVLVVEDEALVRMMAADFFDQSGLVVLEADDAKSALQILQREANRLHVLFTDVQRSWPRSGRKLKAA